MFSVGIYSLVSPWRLILNWKIGEKLMAIRHRHVNYQMHTQKAYFLNDSIESFSHCTRTGGFCASANNIITILRVLQCLVAVLYGGLMSKSYRAPTFQSQSQQPTTINSTPLRSEFFIFHFFESRTIHLKEFISCSRIKS